MNVNLYVSRPIRSLIKCFQSALQTAEQSEARKGARSNGIVRRVASALTVKPRGAVWNDVLSIQDLSLGLHVEWLARDVHPWDRDLPERRQAELFAQQCLEDVDAAIPRLFEQLPEIDVLEIGVLERGSKTRIIAGTIHRSDLVAQQGSSLGMRLRMIGINYHRTNLRFEPIP
jgi:hypothetical protein